jgi:hypothetical protein
VSSDKGKRKKMKVFVETLTGLVSLEMGGSIRHGRLNEEEVATKNEREEDRRNGEKEIRRDR